MDMSGGGVLGGAAGREELGGSRVLKKGGGVPHCPCPPQPYSPAPRPCQAEGNAAEPAPGFSPGSPGKEDSSGEMEWTR